MSPSAIVFEEPPVVEPKAMKQPNSLKNEYSLTNPDGIPRCGLDASKTQILLTENPRQLPSFDTYTTQCHNTDHMVSVQWTEQEGWATPKVVEYGPISLLPMASCLQYATECFEGMKVYRGVDGKLRLFRPMDNCRRMLASAARITLPSFEPEELVKLIQLLCAVDCPKWLPQSSKGSFLYIRPMMVATDISLGPKVPQAATLLVCMASWAIPRPIHVPVADGVSNNMKKSGLRLLASGENEVRAWPGGTGFAKIGPNYGPTFLAHGTAQRQGYDQVLWLFGEDCRVTEAGGANFFIIWRSETNQNLQLLTAPLDDKTILAGVTRQSILDLARDRFTSSSQNEVSNAPMHEVEPLEVIERYFTMSEVIAAAKANRLMAAFAAGTAYFVNPVAQIRFREQDIDIDIGAVPHVHMLRQWLTDIMYGEESSPWTVEVNEV